MSRTALIRFLSASACLAARRYRSVSSTDAGVVDDTSRGADTLLGATTDGYCGIASCGADRREGPGEYSATAGEVEDGLIERIDFVRGGDGVCFHCDPRTGTVSCGRELEEELSRRRSSDPLTHASALPYGTVATNWHDKLFLYEEHFSPGELSFCG